MFLKTKRINGEQRHVVMEAYRKGDRVHLRKIHDLGPVVGRWTRVGRRRLWEDALAQSDELKAALIRWHRDALDLLSEGRLCDQYAADGVKTPSVESRWEEISRRRAEVKHAEEQAARLKHKEEYNRWDRVHEREQAYEHYRRLIAHGPTGNSGCLTVLGLTYPTSEQQIKAAYRRKAVELHPDRGGSNKAMIELTQAYQEARSLVGV